MHFSFINNVTPIIPINTFDNIQITQYKPLIICDIDDTLLYIKDNQPYNISSYLSQSSLLLTDYTTGFTIDSMVRNVLPTDIDGFHRLENRVKMNDGKIVFLTARHPNFSHYVASDFSKIGLDYSSYNIHFTGNAISKGSYILQNIKLDQFGEVHFVDDLIDNHNSVNAIFPNIKRYLFIKSV